jgi:hypothetical protein
MARQEAEKQTRGQPQHVSDEEEYIIWKERQRTACWGSCREVWQEEKRLGQKG